jgi:hypothetical protein
LRACSSRSSDFTALAPARQREPDFLSIALAIARAHDGSLLVEALADGARAVEAQFPA